MATGSENIPISEKQYLAKILFTREKLEQKVVADKVKVSEKTMSKWVNDFGWKKLRERLLVGKEQILSDLYEELEQLNQFIRSKAQGQRFGDAKENDSRLKLTASIRNLETELAIADLVESGIRFIKYLQVTGTIEQVTEFAEIWNGFILHSTKKAVS